MAEGGYMEFSYTESGAASAAAVHSDIGHEHSFVPSSYGTLGMPFRSVFKGEKKDMNVLLDYLEHLKNTINKQSELERPYNYPKGLLIGVILSEHLFVDDLGYTQECHYREIKSMGKGGYGNVWACKDQGTKFDFVTKKIPIHKFNRKEVDIPLLLAGENPGSKLILKVYGVILKDGEMVEIFLQKAECTWSELLSMKYEWKSTDLIFWLHEALTALKYLDDNGIIHMDIKPQNIGILENGHIVLLDYGSCLKRGERNITGITARYTASEVWRGNCTNKADIYSLACSILFLLNGNHVLSEELDATGNHVEKSRRMAKENPKAIHKYIPDRSPRGFDPTLYTYLHNLLYKMTEVSLERRLCAEKALKHCLFHEWQRAKEMSQTQSSAASENEDENVEMEEMSSASSSSTFEFMGSLNSAGPSSAGRLEADCGQRPQSSIQLPPGGHSTVGSVDLQGLTDVLKDVDISEIDMETSKE